MNRHSNRMVRTIFMFTLAAILILGTNVFLVAIAKVHVRSGTDLSAYADSANTVTEVTKALRGNIYDRNGTIIAQDNRTYNIVCILDRNRPSIAGTVAYVEDKEGTAKILSDILKMDYQTVLDDLNLPVYQTELGNSGRNLSKDVKEKIMSYNLPGIEFTDSVQRAYPLGTFASYIVGFAQADDDGTLTGKMGVELYLNDYLSGTDGSRTYQADKDGYILPGMREDVKSAVNGNDVYLTLDEGIQNTMEQSFQITEDRFGASRIWGSVMEIKTGKILAWGQYPGFDPNTLDIEDYNNFGAQLPYEPGSTMKTFVWASAINEGKYDGTAAVYSGPFYYYSDADNNPYRVDPATQKYWGHIGNANNKNWGWTDYDHGLIYSSNVIAASVETALINPDTYLTYLKKFGFFSSVNTDGMREETGTLNFRWPGDKISLSYGQGSTVTMLQMLQAYSAVFGDGNMVRPYFIESIKDGYDSNKVIYQAETKITGTPITADTAKQLQSILYRVVNDSDGTARYYQIPECKIIGKTGTTQVAINGSYDSGTTITSLMAALPADNPQVIVYYAFEAPYDHYAHYYTEAITNLLRKVAMTYGFTTNADTSGTPVETAAATATPTEIQTYDMPDLANHTLDYAQTKLDGMGTQLLVLGGGSTVIDQYPSQGSTVSTGQRVFLVTDTSSFTMPDMTGWTRKDVAALWAVTGFGFKISGEGTVTSQSVPAGTTVTKDTEIEVQLGSS